MVRTGPRRRPAMLSRRPHVMNSNLYATLVEARPPSAGIFIRTPDGRQIGYAELDWRTAQFANTLANKGVEPGDRVAVQVEKSPEAVLLYLACLRAGAVFVPLNTAYTLAEMEYFIGDAEPRVVVCDPARAAALAPVAGKLGVAAVETLDAGGQGTLIERAAGEGTEFDDV